MTAPPLPPSDQRFWLKLRRDRAAMLALVLLGFLYTGALFAGFLAPGDPTTSHREMGWRPPDLTRLHLFDADGTFRGPFVHGLRRVHPALGEYEEDPETLVPVRLFATGPRYSMLGLFETDVHLFGSEDPEQPVFLLGADQFGRDMLSRLLYGSRVSLSVGLLGIAIAMTLGLLIGGLAGYLGGPLDFLLMRLVEVLLSIPTLYLVLAVRPAFGQGLSSTQTYLMVVLVLALVGWAANARVIRGMVLTLRERDFVTAAEALGVGRFRILVRHILPNTWSFAIVTATLHVPYYILSEVALSFLGLGIQEPDASWGNMLRDAQSVRNLTDYPWVLAPGFLIFVTTMAFNYLGDGLRDATDPRSAP